MATRIIIKVDETLSDRELEFLRYLLSDAVAEFTDAREPVLSYVQRRYPNWPVEQQAMKVSQVMDRVALAKKLKGALLTWTSEEVQ